MLALLIPGVGMGGGGSGITFAPTLEVFLALSYENQLGLELAYENRIDVGLSYENRLDVWMES